MKGYTVKLLKGDFAVAYNTDGRRHYDYYGKAKDHLTYGIYAEHEGNARYFVGNSEIGDLGNGVFSTFKGAMEEVEKHHEVYVEEKGFVVRPIPVCQCCYTEMTLPNNHSVKRFKNKDSLKRWNNSWTWFEEQEGKV